MLLDLLLFVLGLVLLVGGGEALVRGASALARRLGLSAALIGLTVVAFGTSAPELVVSLLASAEGKAEIAYGNVVGSNIANVGLLLGLTALFRPLRVDSGLLKREIPLLGFGTLVAIGLGLDHSLGLGKENAFTRGDGIALLVVFAAFLFFNARDVLTRRRTDPFVVEALEAAHLSDGPGLGLATMLTVFGLVALAGGGEMVVSGASSLARGLGVPEVVIGLTLVALGTSLPELATCLAAARKGQDDIAVGNVVGSNLFNLLLVLGITATVRPVPVPDRELRNLLLMAVLTLLLIPFGMTAQQRVTRAEGGVMLALYGLFLFWQVS